MRLIIAALAVLLTTGATARDRDGRYANSPLHEWFEHLETPGGGRCCSDADGTAVADVDWQTANGHYRVRIGDEWLDVPDDHVITEPNRFGRTMVWPYYTNGHPHVRCFMPGSMI